MYDRTTTSTISRTIVTTTWCWSRIRLRSEGMWLLVDAGSRVEGDWDGLYFQDIHEARDWLERCRAYFRDRLTTIA
jgi:hypothetical protein